VNGPAHDEQARLADGEVRAMLEVGDLLDAGTVVHADLLAKLTQDRRPRLLARLATAPLIDSSATSST
jgi:hypothetical protein